MTAEYFSLKSECSSLHPTPSGLSHHPHSQPPTFQQSGLKPWGTCYGPTADHRRKYASARDPGEPLLVRTDKTDFDRPRGLIRDMTVSCIHAQYTHTLHIKEHTNVSSCHMWNQLLCLLRSVIFTLTTERSPGLFHITTTWSFTFLNLKCREFNWESSDWTCQPLNLPMTPPMKSYL